MRYSARIATIQVSMDVQKTMEFILEQQAHCQSLIDQSTEQHKREMAEIRKELRRGIRLSVEEARRERKRRHELDARLTAAQAVTEEKLQRLIDNLNRPRTNGHETEP